MTVKELIKKLKEYPENAPVMLNQRGQYVSMEKIASYWPFNSNTTQVVWTGNRMKNRGR